MLCYSDDCSLRRLYQNKKYQLCMCVTTILADSVFESILMQVTIDAQNNPLTDYS